MRGKRRRGRNDEDNGFAAWGGYMEAKKSKLEDQFKIDASKEPSTDGSDIFKGVAIFVNGFSVPSADELKLLMMKHGGVYHHYHRSGQTTHIIATNLPDTKVKTLRNMNVVKPEWVTESIKAGRLLDYRQFLLYSQASRTQPRLAFKPAPVAGLSTSSDPEPAVTQFENSSPSEVDCEEEPLNDICSPDMLDVKIDNSVQRTSKMSNSIKTASETGFLSEFYSNSRLHHISTMGATFKQYVNTLREKTKGVFLGVEKIKTWKKYQVSNSFDVSMKFTSVIMHIDMDCFFVSVGLRKRPDLKGFPVAVTHAKGGSEAHRSGVDRKAEFELYKTRREEKSRVKNQCDVLDAQLDDVKPWSDWVDTMDQSDSMSEIASCNYEARKMGLKNGMFLGQALKLCPNLKTIPYDFEGYKEVSYCLYDTVASYSLDVEAVSCDEMFVDVTALLNSAQVSPLQLASLLRAQIREKTGCPASTGFGGNRLQARLATRRAKPDGQFYLEPSAVSGFMQEVKVSDLPGVGRSTHYKLAARGVHTCLDLQQLPLSRLQADFGLKIGESLYKHCRGEDSKKLVFGHVRKSVSAEVNYGIRFQSGAEADQFLEELAAEVHSRLQDISMTCKLLTLKLMVRAADAPAESAKFLGHGVCDHVTRSSSLAAPTRDLDTIIREVMSLSRQLHVEPSEMRGIGIQLSRLERAGASGPSSHGIDKFLRPKTEISTVTETKLSNVSRTVPPTKDDKKAPSSIDDFFASKKNLPNQNKKTSSNANHIKPAEIDKDFLEALPEDIRREVIQEYGLRPWDEAGPSTDRRPTRPDKPVQFELNYSQIDPEVLEELPLEIKQEIQTSVINRKKCLENASSKHSDTKESVEVGKGEVEGPKLDSGLPVSEVRTLIKAWTSSEQTPQPCDVSMMTDYLQALVRSGRLDGLDQCVSCLHRCIEKQRSSSWQQVYHSIMLSVQQAVVAAYGLPLSAPRVFNTAASYHSLL